MNVTLEEAKKRFENHTKKVLSDYSKALLKKGIEWKVIENNPFCVLGNEITIGFEKDKKGNVRGIWIDSDDLFALIKTCK